MADRIVKAGTKPRGVRGVPFQKGCPPGPGRPPGPNKATVEAKEFARGIIESPAYRASLEQRVNESDLAPAVEVLLWHYAYGKPKETTELKGGFTIRWLADHESEPDGE